MTHSGSTRPSVLLVFTRFPVAGRSKTRLIPLLGAEGAAQLQRDMTEHMVARALAGAIGNGAILEICHDDADSQRMKQWLGGACQYAVQGDGHLGERLTRAFAAHFQRGAGAVVAIGADCPGVDAALIGRALAELRSRSLVLGPALDGGYYLIGLDRPMPQLFEGIAWGTGRVLEQTVATARQSGIEPAWLEPLSDVDTPEDLGVWQAAQVRACQVSIVIPAFNEAANLEATLARARRACPEEIIVSDGGSTDATVELARAGGAAVVSAPRGRARQMNAGAAAARNGVLLFLHADTWLPENGARLAAQALGRNGTVGGAFTFRLREPMRGGRMVEWLTNFRSRRRRLPYGDQGLFLRHDLFMALGGFPDWPVLEDVALVRRLRRLGRLAIMDEPVWTSARRWRSGGLIRTFLRHQLILLGHACGVPPEQLAGLRR